MRSRRRTSRALLLSITPPLSLAIICPPARGYDNSFDYTSFETGFGQAQFNVLNYPSINGNFMMTSTDNHRGEMNVNGNELAQFYNNFLADYNTQYPNLDAAAQADKINQYSITNSTKNGGPKPQWVILNEISSSVWQDATQKGVDYRNWVIDCVTRLKDVHGFTVVTYSPYATVGSARAADWQRLAAKSYIGIENYLSGAEVMNGGSDYASRLAWAQAQYQASKNTYTGAAGVPANKLFLGEHFASTIAGTGWGRSGIAAADWDTVLQIRQDAIRAVGFEGFLAYNHGGNGMGITQAEQIQHEYYYRSKLVLASQQPQWLSDGAINVNGTVIPLSWGQFLNWKGGVPDAPGAVANFYRTNTAARTVTLDGSRTVGTLSFNSPSSYTLSPGSGGTLTLNNGVVGGAGSSVSVAQGSHTVAVAVSMIDNATFNIAAGSLALTGGLTNISGRKLTKSGAGTLTIGGTQTHGAGATLDALAGTTNFASSGGANLAINAAATVNFNSSQHLAALAISPGVTVTLAPDSARTLNVATLTDNGTLNLTDNNLIVRNNPAALGSWNGSAYRGVTGLVQKGHNGGAWNGTGIVTSESAAGEGLTTLAVAPASAVADVTSAQTTLWNGQTVSGDDVLVMYTYAGDANLDGLISGDDYASIDGNVSVPGSAGWYNGDFNYDGIVSGDDYATIDSNIVAQGAPLADAAGGQSAAVVTVPEPAAGLAGLAGPFLFAARRRRRLE